MITFAGVEVTYEGAAQPTLTGVDLRIGEGELCVVIGPTGSGKSTLLGAVNGHVPHFTGGRLSGRVQVAGRDTADNPPRDLADVVGVVGQDPLNGFVTETVEEELAFSMEQIGLPAAVMRTRVEETLDLLGIADLRLQPLRSLSGGQQQRVAIGAALTAHPAVLVLDEPTSALDPTAAEEVLAAIMRLVHDLGVTAMVAEHRLERILQYADRVIEVHRDGTVTSGSPGEVMPDAAVAPPVVRLGRVMDWVPLPMSVRDARRFSPALRERLVDVAPPPATSTSPVGLAPDAPGTAQSGAEDHRPPALIARSVSVRFGDVVAVRDVDLTLDAGCVVALMGRNGAGKSSLLWALQGTGRRDVGQVDVGGVDPGTLKPADARRAVGLVPQTAGDLLYHATVADECTQADHDAGVSAGACRMMLDDLVPGLRDDSHPRDLSEGQRLALALAVQLLARPAVLLLDEPTRGLDYGAKDSLTRIIRRLAAEGLALVISSHDVEFVANTADRVVVMAQGDVVANGPTADVVVASPTFAPQVAKVLGLPGWLTVSQVRRAVEHTRRDARRTG